MNTARVLFVAMMAFTILAGVIHDYGPPWLSVALAIAAGTCAAGVCWSVMKIYPE